jgi:hypothetical protein
MGAGRGIGSGKQALKSGWRGMALDAAAEKQIPRGLESPLVMTIKKRTGR